MKTYAAFVRLALVAWAFWGSCCAMGERQSGLVLPDAPIIYESDQICRSFYLCPSSKQGLPYISMQVFAGLDDLFSELELSPVAQYVSITAASGCAAHGCCCSSPVEVSLSLPAGSAAAGLGQRIAHYIRNKLPKSMPGITCMSDLQLCSTPIATERRRLLSEDDVALEAAVSPVPAMPHGFSPFSLAVLESALESSDFGGQYGSSIGSYGDYGSGCGYGYYAQQVEAHNRPASRSLLAVPPTGNQQQPKIKEHRNSNSNNNSSKSGSCPPCPACSRTPSSNNGGVPKPQQQLRGSTSGTARPATAGSCYCRYNAQSASWALEESACRAALLKRCGPAGSLLECAHLEAHYAARLAPGREAPHVDAISAFLFVDCPPAPPCSCKALTDSKHESKEAKDLCCADLKAHCQVPFSGLDCEDVVKFCSKSSAQDNGAVTSFALVKTHNINCEDADFAAAYSSTTPDTEADRLGEAAAVLLSREVEQWGRAAARRENFAFGMTLVMTLMASCIAIGVVLSAVLLLVQRHGIRRYTTPLTGG